MDFIIRLDDLDNNDFDQYKKLKYDKPVVKKIKKIQLNISDRKELKKQYLREYRKKKCSLICQCGGKINVCKLTHFETTKHKQWLLNMYNSIISA